MVRTACLAATLMSAVAFAVVFAAGCGMDTSRTGMATIVRDSAGVEIVESRLPDRVVPLPSTPLVELGRDEGGLTFFGVAAVIALEGGRFVVADNASRELRYFDATGAHERTSGGDGDGPGEYRRFMWVQRLGQDTLAVFDPRSRRISLLDGAGSYVGSLNYSTAQSTPPQSGVLIPSMPNGLFADRSGLVSGDVALQRGSTDGRRTVHGVLLRHHFADARQDTLVSVPLLDQYWRPDVPFPSAVIFGPMMSRALAGQSVLVATGRDYEIRSYTSDAVLRRIARVATVPLRPVTAAHREAYAADGQQEEEAIYASTLPAYTKLIPADGGLWALEFRAPGADVGSAHVFDDRGVLTAVVELPASFTPHDVRDGRVYGVSRDELGVETIQVYTLDPTVAS